LGATDFQTLFYGILPSIKDNFGWTDGVNKLYTTLSNDFLYKDPTKNNIFLDNHDITRIATELGGDVNKIKMGLAWLLTCRGIPQIYYGTEVMMKGDKGINDGMVRKDFPGGWTGDAKNAFTQQGLTDDEKDLQNFTQKLANYRKKSSAITTGKLMQYVPNDGLYVYFRYDNNQSVMCVMNTSEKEQTVDFINYEERTKGFIKAKEIITDTQYNSKFTIPAKRMWVLELVK
jgi:glycosidase